MSETENLKLLKHDNPTTNENQFDIDIALNNNWDKVDNFAITANEKIQEIEEKVTKQYKLIEDLQSENKRLKSQIPQGQASGEYIHLTDSSDLPFDELKISGNVRKYYCLQ